MDYARNGGDGGATEKLIHGAAKVNRALNKKGSAAFEEGELIGNEDKHSQGKVEDRTPFHRSFYQGVYVAKLGRAHILLFQAN